MDRVGIIEKLGEFAEWTPHRREELSRLREELERMSGGWSKARIFKEPVNVQCGWNRVSREMLREVDGEYIREGWQNASSQNMPLRHKDYFELIILRNSRHRRSSENSVEVPLT